MGGVVSSSRRHETHSVLTVCGGVVPHSPAVHCTTLHCPVELHCPAQFSHQRQETHSPGTGSSGGQVTPRQAASKPPSPGAGESSPSPWVYSQTNGCPHGGRDPASPDRPSAPRARQRRVDGIPAPIISRYNQLVPTSHSARGMPPTDLNPVTSPRPLHPTCTACKEGSCSWPFVFTESCVKA